MGHHDHGSNDGQDWYYTAFEVEDNGRSFLLRRGVATENTGQIVMVVNWLAEVKAKMSR